MPLFNLTNLTPGLVSQSTSISVVNLDSKNSCQLSITASKLTGDTALASVLSFNFLIPGQPLLSANFNQTLQAGIISPNTSQEIGLSVVLSPQADNSYEAKSLGADMDFVFVCTPQSSSGQVLGVSSSAPQPYSYLPISASLTLFFLWLAIILI